MASITTGDIIQVEKPSGKKQGKVTEASKELATDGSNEHVGWYLEIETDEGETFSHSADTDLTSVKFV